ncbi:MAG: hypothetical protein ACK4S4_05510 [Pyrinomonadaceae bacterium]
MIFRRAAFLPLVVLSLLVVTAASCAGGDADTGPSNTSVQAANANTDSARTNVEELGMLVNVPYESEEVFWKEDAGRKRLVAVLMFPSSEAERLVADAAKLRAPEPVSMTPESWFPPELVAQGEMSGDSTIKGQAYAADAFLQPPYSEGRIARIDGTDYFVLEVFAR